MEPLPKIVHDRLQAASTGDHPDPNLLAAFAEKLLTPREQTQVMDHLAACSDCREVVALSAPQFQMEHVAMARAMAVGASSAPLAQSVAAPARMRWLNARVVSWAALAACVLVVGTVMLKRYTPDHTVATVAPAANELKNQTAQLQAPESSDHVVARLEPPATAPPAASPNAVPARIRSAEKLRAQAESTFVGGRLGGVTAGIVAPKPAAPPPSIALDRDDKTRQYAYAVPSMPQKDALADKAMSIPKSTSQSVTVEGATPVVTVETATAASQPVQESAHSVNEIVTVETKQLPVNGRNMPELAAKKAATAKATTAVEENRKAEIEGDLAKAKDSQGAYLAGAQAGSGVGSFARLPRPLWKVSSEGMIMYSLDTGATWQSVPVADKVAFHTVFAFGQEIWAGGAQGRLYHSPDGGANWKQIKPTASGHALEADITSIQFADPQHGQLTTAKNETWTTADGGQTWKRK